MKWKYKIIVDSLKKELEEHNVPLLYNPKVDLLQILLENNKDRLFYIYQADYFFEITVHINPGSFPSLTVFRAEYPF